MAHGLVLKLEEMLQRNLVNGKDMYEIISEEDKIIKLWNMAVNQPIVYKLDYFRILRETLVFVLTPPSLMDHKRKELLGVVINYCNAFSDVLKINWDIRKPLIDVIQDPWKNPCFSWDEFFQRKYSYNDQKVQEYFAYEPEEILMARVHTIMLQGKEDMAMELAKTAFFYYSRIAKSLSKDVLSINPMPQSASWGNNYKKGISSMDWYLFILQRKKLLPEIVNEVKQLTCHEGVQLVQRLRRTLKNQNFIFTLLQILLVQELVQSSKFCCTKKIFALWCIMHKEKRSGVIEINQAIRKMLAMHAPSSAHFYLFADALWEQYGHSLITLYVELYVRGLTVDINHLEAARNGDGLDDTGCLEMHIASVCAKLSTLFSDFHEGAARECMFSAFSLKPTKERLYILQSLTHSILSTENEMKLGLSLNVNSMSQECKCDVRCDGSCKGLKEYYLEHPILKKGIPNIPYILVKDLVCVLESVRCFNFQYNVFDWRNNAIDLGDYLKEFTLTKSWECDTEYASEGSNRSDVEDNYSESKSPTFPLALVNDNRSLSASGKRKNSSDGPKELFSLDIGANIEVGSDDFGSKRMKVLESKTNEILRSDQEVVTRHEMFTEQSNPIKNYGNGMEDAIENVIRMTLDSSQRPNVLLNNNFMNTSLNHAHDGTENLTLSSVNRQHDNNVYPYSLTSFGKNNSLNSSFKESECSSSKSSDQHANKYVQNIVVKPTSIQKVLVTPPEKESIISPVTTQKKFITMQEQSYNQVPQSKLFAVKAVQSEYYNNKDDLNNAQTINKLPNASMSKTPVYQQVPLNLGTNSHQQVKVHNTNTQRSPFTNAITSMHISNKSGVLPSDFSKSRFSSSTSMTSSSTMTSPVTTVQTKLTLPKPHSAYPSTSHNASKSSPVFRPDTKFHFVDCSNTDNGLKRIGQNIGYQYNQLPHDRSSVIQHTMQHVKENAAHEINETEIPNQLIVSVNANAADQIRCAPKKQITNLPPFTVNITDKKISNSVALSASLVIARKPPVQPQTEIAFQPVCSSLTTVTNSDTITIPGILASPSVIVSSWEAQRKSHGELMYKKNTNAVNVSNIDKKIYRNRLPCGKHIVFKPEPKLTEQPVRTNKPRNFEVFKAASPSHINHSVVACSVLNQNQPNSSHVSSVVNKSSTQGISQPTPSQPWYSEPYPKSYNTGRNTSKLSGNLHITGEQNTTTVAKQFQPIKTTSNVRSFAAYTPPIHQNKNNVQTVSVPATVAHNPVLHLEKSSVFTNKSAPPLNSNTTTVLKEPVSQTDFVYVSSSQTNRMANIRTYSTQNNLLRDNSVNSPNEYIDIQTLGRVVVQDEKNPVVFMEDSYHCQTSSQNISKSCCSPSEINPCHNCSLPPFESNLLQSSSPRNLESDLEQRIPSSRKKISGDNLLSLSGSKNKSATTRFLPDSKTTGTFAICQYCSQSFLSTELEIHILNSHSKELGIKSSNFYTDDGSTNMLTENARGSIKSLPDVVPEQDSLFQRDSFQNNLPHAKIFINPVENQKVAENDKHLDDIEANAFNACMDLINNDKDLKRIVQGIDSFDEIDNNYLPFIPATGNILNTNLCDEIQKASVPYAPLEYLPVSDKIQFDDYSVQCDNLQLETDKLNSGKVQNSVFEFTEKDYEASKPAQKLAHAKPNTTCAENILPKTSNELTFSALAEMIKVTITDCNAELESVEASVKDSHEEIPQRLISPVNTESTLRSCMLCSKNFCSSGSLKRHNKTVHPDLYANNSNISPSPKMDLSSISSSGNNFLSNSDVNSLIEKSNSLTPIMYSDAKQNHDIPSTSEIGPNLPKGRIKGITKLPTTKCTFCGKILSSVYMKKHVLTQHSENSVVKLENSSDLNVGNVSSASQADTSNFTAISTLLEQDIDSSTCLSVSDALKRNASYTIADVSNLSDGSGKLTENTNLKFNFNVLEFSKDNKPKVSTFTKKKDLSTKISQPCLSPKNNITDAEENKIKPNLLYTNKNGLVLQKYQCHLCSKSYVSSSGLYRHKKTHHDSEFSKAPKKSRNLNKPDEVKCESKNGENQLTAPVISQQNVSIQSVNAASTINVDVQISKESLPCTSKAAPPQLATYLKQKMGKNFKKSFAQNDNNSLLKSVLNSNFVSKQLETKDSQCPKEDLTYCSKENLVLSDQLHAETFESNPKLCSTQLGEAHCSNTSKEYEYIESKNLLDSELQCDSKVSVSVPSEMLLENQDIKGQSNVIADANHPSTSAVIESSQLQSVLHGTDINLQTKCSNLTDPQCNGSSQNLSVQSNEISSISEIISNVSKCHFGGTIKIEGNEKELFEDNSLKLVIPEDQGNCETFENEEKQQSLVPDLIKAQELNPVEELGCIKIPVQSDAVCNKLKSCGKAIELKIEEEAIESKSDEFSFETGSISNSTEIEYSKRCRLCHQNLNSMESLSKHLKEVHDIPVLRKHISPLGSPKPSVSPQESIKLSPPKLKLGTNDSDSESLSNFDILHSLKSKNDHENNPSKNSAKMENCSPSMVQPEWKSEQEEETSSSSNSFVQSDSTESKIQSRHLESLIQPLNFPIPYTECQPKQVTVTSSPCKYKFRRHSFCDTKSFSLEVKKFKSLPSSAFIPLVSSNVDFKSTCENIKVKSVSLPNFQVALGLMTDSHVEHEPNKTDMSVKSIDLASSENDILLLKETEVAVDHSSGENSSFSSGTELSKTSCDVSSQNFPIKWNAISIKSSFLLNPHISKLNSTQSVARNKISNRKLILQKIKSYKGQKKIRRTRWYSCHKKFQSRKTFKPLILTLKEATEISEFLKTHKQPIVKLIRLKEGIESSCSPNTKIHPIVEKYCMKEAVVKLERLHIPSDFGDLVFVNQKLLASNLLSQDSHFNSLTMQNPESKNVSCPSDVYLGSSSADNSHCESSTLDDNSHLLIDISDSNDTHQTIETITLDDVKCPIKTEKSCNVPLMKKCFVALTRLPI